jgi:hypothetical protein
MMGTGDKVKIFVGESFIEVSEEFATDCKSFKVALCIG